MPQSAVVGIADILAPSGLFKAALDSFKEQYGGTADSDTASPLGDFWRQMMHLNCKRVWSSLQLRINSAIHENLINSAAMTDEARADAAVAIDKLRASKAGHAYHEAWAARTALELLLPATDLTAITLEGFDEQDEQELGTGAVEIADLVRYHGGTDVARAHRVDIVQFKYSIARAEKAVRAADLASTLVKFAITDAELRSTHGNDHVENVVHYEFATNRPIHENLAPAINALIAGANVDGDVRRQARQVAEALKDYPHETVALLRRLELVGSKGSLIDAERQVSATLAAWSEPGDPDAEKRLLKLRNLIRIKAGPGSETDKRVDRVAVLAELEVDHENRLYPTPDALSDISALETDLV